MACAGWPRGALTAYSGFMQDLRVRSSFPSSLGKARTRTLSIPQGGRWSMVELALVVAPWMRCVAGGFPHAAPRSLADDLMVQTSQREGQGPLREQEHFQEHVEAARLTPVFAQDIGAVVTMTKRFTLPSRNRLRARFRKVVRPGAPRAFT
eukprot:9935534-Alexandrium_andersonii.AAC.1